MPLIIPGIPLPGGGSDGGGGGNPKGPLIIPGAFPEIGVGGHFSQNPLPPGPPGSGGVSGPTTSLLRSIARWINTDGTKLTDSAVQIDDGGNIITDALVDGRRVSADGATLDAVVAQLVNLPSATQKAALVGVGGVPSGANPYVVNSDPRLAGGGGINPPAGQIGGSTSHPTVLGIRETGGPTELTFGAVPDGTFLRRQGSSAVGNFGGAAILNVLDFGVKNDGSVDAGAGINSIIAAMDAAINSLGVLLYVPKGTYKLSTGLNIKRRIVMFGDGMFSTILRPDKNVVGINLHGPSDSDDGGRADDTVIRDLGVQYASQTTSAWLPTHAYLTGDTVYAVTNKNYQCVFVCQTAGVSGGTEPGAFATATENGLVANRTVNDGGVVWRATVLAGIRLNCRATLQNVFVDFSPGNGIHCEASVGAAGSNNFWLPSHAYSPGFIVDNNGKDYICTVGGTSAGSGGPGGVGVGIIDGGVTWNFYDYNRNANGFLLDKINSYNSATNGWFVQGSDVNASNIHFVDVEQTSAVYPMYYDNSFLGNTYVGCQGANQGGGSYYLLNNNATGALFNCYSEGGSGASVINHPNIVVGGQHAAGFSTGSDGVIWTGQTVLNTWTHTNHNSTFGVYTQLPYFGNYAINFNSNTETGAGNSGITLQQQGDALSGAAEPGWWTWSHANLDARAFMGWSGVNSSVGPGRLQFMRGFYLGTTNGGRIHIKPWSSPNPPNAGSDPDVVLPISDRGSLWINRNFGEPPTGGAHGTWAHQVIGPDASTPLVQTLRWPHLGANNQVDVTTSSSGSPFLIDWLQHCGCVFTNTGASSQQFLRLPQDHSDDNPDIKFSEFSFYVQNANGLRVTANTGLSFQYGSYTGAVGGYLESLTPGSFLRVKILGSSVSPRPSWVIVDLVGSWTDGTEVFTTGAVQLETVAPLTLAISPSGTDGFVVGRPPVIVGGNYALLPFLTFAGARAALPPVVNHVATVTAAAGSYVGGANWSGLQGTGSLLLAGTLSLATLTTGPNTGTAGAGSGSTVVNQPTGAINWTPHEMRGMWLVPQSGGGAGTPTNPWGDNGVRIRDNSATQVFLESSLAGLDSTTVFDILSEATSVSGVGGTVSGGIYDGQTYCLGVIGSGIPIRLARLKLSGSGVSQSLLALSTPSLDLRSTWLTTGSAVVGLGAQAVINGLRETSHTLTVDTQAEVSARGWILDTASVAVNGCQQFNLFDVDQIIDNGVAAFRATGCAQVGVGGNWASNVAGTPIQISNIQKFQVNGSLTGTNAGTTYGVQIDGGGQYNLVGATITGAGDVNGAQVFIEDSTGAFSWTQINGNSYFDYKGNFVLGGGSLTAVMVAGIIVFNGSTQEYNLAYKLGNAYKEITAQHTAPSITTATKIGYQQTTVTGATADGDAVRFFGDIELVTGGFAGTIYNATANWVALYPQLAGNKIIWNGVDQGVGNAIWIPPGRAIAYISDSGANWHVTSLGPPVTVQVVANVSPILTQSGTVYNNATASGDVVISLPASPTPGLTRFAARVGSANYIKFLANTGQTIYVGNSVSATAGFVRANAVGSTLLIEALTSTIWIVTDITGAWAVDS